MNDNILNEITNTIESHNRGRRKDFFQGGNSAFFQALQKDFSRVEPKEVKFHFTLSKLREQPFFQKNITGKCHILRSRGVPRPPPQSQFDAHGHNYRT